MPTETKTVPVPAPETSVEFLTSKLVQLEAMRQAASRDIARCNALLASARYVQVRL